MQAQQQRQSNRRSPVSGQNGQNNTAAMSMPPPPQPPSAPASQPPVIPGSRSSSGSSKSGSKRSKDPSQQLSQIEKSVTHLLIATKQLLETLTQWSRHSATEGEVSDVYVRLGYEFNIACRAFTSIGVPTDDLGPVPDLLRGILEETLSQEASPASLDKFLPRIRDIIINLLHGLKKKQSKLRATRARDVTQQPNGQPLRQASIQSSTTAFEGELNQALPDTSTEVSNQPSLPSSERRVGSGGGATLDSAAVPPRAASLSHGPTPAPEEPAPTPQEPLSAMQEPAPNTQEEQAPYRQTGSLRANPRTSRIAPTYASSSSLSSTTANNLPVLGPEDQDIPQNTIQPVPIYDEISPPPPPPPPKEQDAMTLLQRGGDLERRASRRYSAYQIQRHLGPGSGNVPMLPPVQNSPIPNRGRDVRESMNAVRTRGSYMPSRQRSVRVNESSSPSRGTRLSRQIAEESSRASRGPFRPPQEPSQEESPVSKTPEDKLGCPWPDSKKADGPALTGTLIGPPDDTLPQFPAPASTDSEREPEKYHTPAEASQAETVEATIEPQFIPEDSPQPGTELTLFLQYKTKIKKFVLPDGVSELSLARLQLAFIEKFAWNTHSNGNDLPEIYLQDPVSGVRHELEDLSDVKDRSVLVLNVEPLDEVKKHFDEGLGGLKKVIESVRFAVDGQQAALSRVSERQQEAANEIARIASLPSAPQPVQDNGVKHVVPASDESMHEIQTLRRDLAIMRQTFSSFTTDVNSSVSAIRAKADTVKAKAIDATIPVLTGDSGRAYVNSGKKELGDESEVILGRVDDLQDLVEDLRKDVVMRGVRPAPRQLEASSKDISDATKELKKMQEYVKREKPIWTKIWEQELQEVCDDREFLSLQENLIADLEEDLDMATQTMSLVEQAAKQQNLQAPPGQANLRNTSRGLNFERDIDPQIAKNGVLGEVRALQPNHEGRLEAIERAEKARQRELESRRENAAFKKELGSFVEEGKLKKSGGVDEIDKQRQVKDERAMREEFDAQQVRKVARAKAKAEERARKMAEAQQGGSEVGDGQSLDGLTEGSTQDGSQQEGDGQATAELKPEEAGEA